MFDPTTYVNSEMYNRKFYGPELHKEGGMPQEKSDYNEPSYEIIHVSLEDNSGTNRVSTPNVLLSDFWIPLMLSICLIPTSCLPTMFTKIASNLLPILHFCPPEFLSFYIIQR